MVQAGSLGTSWERVRNARPRASALTCCVGIPGAQPPHLREDVPVPLGLVAPEDPCGALAVTPNVVTLSLRTHSVLSTHTPEE